MITREEYRYFRPLIIREYNPSTAVISSEYSPPKAVITREEYRYFRPLIIREYNSIKAVITSEYSPPKAVITRVLVFATFQA